MSKTFYQLLNATVGVDMEYAGYVANKGTELYLRNLSENVTSECSPPSTRRFSGNRS